MPPKRKNVERGVQKAVDEILNTNEWPIFKAQDDRGLEQSEYYDFAMAVIRKLKLKPLEKYMKAIARHAKENGLTASRAAEIMIEHYLDAEEAER